MRRRGFCESGSARMAHHNISREARGREARNGTEIQIVASPSVGAALPRRYYSLFIVTAYTVNLPYLCDSLLT